MSRETVRDFSDIYCLVQRFSDSATQILRRAQDNFRGQRLLINLFIFEKKEATKSDKRTRTFFNKISSLSV